MSENSRGVVAAVVVGTVGGAIVGYLLFTDRGRETRQQIEAMIEDTAQEFNRLRGTVQKATACATEALSLLNQVVGEAKGKNWGERPPYPGTRQTDPF